MNATVTLPPSLSLPASLRARVAMNNPPREKLPQQIRANVHELWRPWPYNDRGPRPMLTGLGEFSPHYTNGVLVWGSLGDDSEFTAHITNVPKIERDAATPRPRKTATKPRKPKHEVVVSCDDLL